MSDNFLRLIPQEPSFQPSLAAEEAAACALKSRLPTADVGVHRFSEIQFVDQGGNFERVLCPKCKAEITSYWQDWMEESYKTRFAERTITLPCCLEQSDLNDLVHEWPAGFATFKLEVKNHSEWLPRASQDKIEALLGCRIRQILARY